MSNTLAIELLALAQQTGDGTGPAIAIGDLRSAVDLDLTVTVIASGEIEVYVQTSPDGSTGWRTVGTFGKVAAAGKLRGTFDGCDAWVRAGWDLAGNTTFKVAGKAYTVYAKREDLQDALPDDVYTQADEKDPGRIARMLIKGTSHVAHRVGGAHPLPLTEWTPALVEATACMSAYYVLRKHQLEAGGVELLVAEARAEAIEWLKEVQRGEVKQLETTPEQELGARIVSGNPDEPDTFHSRFSDDWGDFG